MILKRNKSAYWYYDFTLAGDRYRGSTKEKTKNAAQAYEAALRTRISERGPSARPKKAPQFREFVPAFRGFIKHHTGLSPKSKAYYEDGIGLLLNSSVASMRLDHIKKSHIQTLQLPGSASWQNCAVRTLRRMLAIAKEWGLLWEVPTVPLLEQRQRRDVFDQEVEIQIAAKARQPLQDVFVTMMDTGCRPGEVLALRWEDILWDLGVIFVRRGKTKKSIRYVPMSDRVRDRLPSTLRPVVARVTCSPRHDRRRSTSPSPASRKNFAGSATSSVCRRISCCTPRVTASRLGCST
jgi:integrase